MNPRKAVGLHWLEVRQRQEATRERVPAPGGKRKAQTSWGNTETFDK